jgi:hypothetical protein
MSIFSLSEERTSSDGDDRHPEDAPRRRWHTQKEESMANAMML